MKTIMRAEELRYLKIQRLTDLFCGNGNTADITAALDLTYPFNAGRRIIVDGENIIIKNKKYSCFELQKITINTEGSIAVYGCGGKKLIGCLGLNAASENIELFALWSRKYNVPAEAVSGKYERAFVWGIFAFALSAVILIKILRIFEKL